MRKTAFKVIIVFTLFFCSCIQCFGEDLFVPEDFPSINEAVEAAEFGDTIHVGPGIYYERVIIKEGISLVSDSGPEGENLVTGPGEKKVLKRVLQTIIDGSRLSPPDYLVSFHKESDAPMRLDGFTIRNLPKKTIDRLFLVEVRGSSPTIINNIICRNHSKGKGGGLLLTGLGPSMGPPLETGAKPIIQNNIIHDNFGPGIANGSNSFSLIKDNEIFNNHFPQANDTEPDAPGIGMREYARPSIIHNLCYRNGSGIGGLDLVDHDQSIEIKNNILYHNSRAGIGLRAINNAQKKISVLIEGNEIFGNLRAGIFTAFINETIIKKNRIYNNLRAGLAQYKTEHTEITQNNIFGNLTVGLILEAKKALIEDNHIYNNLHSGINILPSAKPQENKKEKSTANDTLP